jgi:hypothetical protein
MMDRGSYHHQSPDAVVQKYDRGGREHGEADKFVKLYDH